MKIKYVFTIAFLILSGLSTLDSQALTLKEFSRRPKLVVYIVIDQLRADQLSLFKFRNDKKSGFGYEFLMSQGAYIPFTKYAVMQAMTCPGHATIATGTWPANHGIVLNEWYDRATRKKKYCAEDDTFKISPRNLLSDTMTDEADFAGILNKLVSISLKDRAAVMLGGLRGKKVYWMDSNEAKWTSSGFYQSGVLPNWVSDQKLSLKPDQSLENLMASPWGVEQTTDLALKALKAENLGRSVKTDFLMISYSSHDMVGHQSGPDSDEMKKLMHSEDQQISRLISGIKANLGSLDSVAVVLTADHGIPPLIPPDPRNKSLTGKLDDIEVVQKLSAHLNEHFKIKGSVPWLEYYRFFHIFLDRQAIEARGLKFQEVLLQAKQFLLTTDGVDQVIVSGEQQVLGLSNRLSVQVGNSVHHSRTGDLLIVPKPFFTDSEKNLVNHITGYSYDSTVPLILWGHWFKPEVSLVPAQVVDIAPTMAAILGILPPAKSEGRILSEVIR